MTTEWITIAEAAERWKLSPKSIRRMISRGELEAARFGPRLIRINPSSVDSLVRRLHA